jgi:hypothetical protein
MFFYSEKVALTLSSSVNNLKFSNIATNSSSSLTFTVSFSDGDATEIITVSDNSDQFSFSPSTFALGPASPTQVVTVSFQPSSSMRKTGTITVTSAGGSAKSVSLSGSATNETRIPVGSELAYSSSVTLGGVAPLDPPDGSQGWFYNKTVSNTTKAEWNYYSRVKQDGSTVSKNFGLSGSNLSAYMVASFPNTGSITKCLAGNGPFINIYTQHNVGPGPNAASWYKSRINHYPSGTLANYVTGSDYLFYTTTDPVDIHPEIPANRRYKMRLTPFTVGAASTGSMLDGQIVDLVRVSSNSSAAASLGLSFTVRNAGTYFSDLSEEAVFLRSGSV